MNELKVNKNKIKESCEYFGTENTFTVVMEECAELIQCVSKESRGKDSRAHMEEEIGDVLISISDLIYICDLSEKNIQRWIDFKQNRQSQRMRK